MSVYIKNCNIVLVYFLILSYDHFFVVLLQGT